MVIGPVVRSLMRHKTTTFLIALQSGLTLAVLINALLVVQQKREIVQRDIGFDSEFVIGVSSLPLRDGENRVASAAAEMAALRALPSVKSVSMVSGIPLTSTTSAHSVTTGEGKNERSIDSVDVVIGDEQLLPTLGLTLVAGRNFSAEDVFDSLPREAAPEPQVTLITEAVARTLFGTESALGKQINDMTVIGVVKDFVLSDRQISNERLGMIVPGRRYVGWRGYLIRTDGPSENHLEAIEKTLRQVNPDRFLIGRFPLQKQQKRVQSDERGIVIGLSVVMALISVIALAGIIGINAYHLRKRLRWFGVRRALGASRRDVVIWLLLESVVMAFIGVVIGVVCAVLLNMQAPAIPRLMWHHVIVASLLVSGLVFLSTLLTARPALSVSPAMATRTL